MFGIRRRGRSSGDEAARGDGLSVMASLRDGPLKGRRIPTAFIQGRAPGTIDVPGAGCAHRYGLTEWAGDGPSAHYAFLYDVPNDGEGG